MTGAAGYWCGGMSHWFTTLPITADGVSAFATLAATGVALWLPARMARKEWARQDQLRLEDRHREDRLRAEQAGEAKNARCYVIHQGASTVDQILAYWQTALAISESKPVYHEGFAAIARIRENVLTLREILMVIRHKPDLSDGLLFTMVNADRIADAILKASAPPQNGQGHDWATWVHRLDGQRALVEMTQKRNNEVRAAFGLQASASAEAIRIKYRNLADAIKAALATQGLVDMTAVPQNHY